MDLAPDPRCAGADELPLPARGSGDLQAKGKGQATAEREKMRGRRRKERREKEREERGEGGAASDGRGSPPAEACAWRFDVILAPSLPRPADLILCYSHVGRGDRSRRRIWS